MGNLISHFLGIDSDGIERDNHDSTSADDINNEINDETKQQDDQDKKDAEDAANNEPIDPPDQNVPSKIDTLPDLSNITDAINHAKEVMNQINAGRRAR